MFDWSDDYSVGVGSIDREHQKLFKIAAELHSAVVVGRSEAVMEETLHRLVRFTQFHFAHEERLMEQSEYPDFAAHKVLHQALTERVLGFQAEFQSGRLVLSQLLIFLKAWLADHTRIRDAAYASFVKDEDAA